MVQWIQTNAIQLLGILVPLIIGVGGWFFKKNSGASVNKQKAKTVKNSTINQAGGNISINSGGKEDDE